MKFLGNIIWLLFGGIITSVEYLISSLILMVTIIGIPFGLQTLKLAILALWPFGSRVVDEGNSGGCLSLIMNVIWIFVGGFWICLTHLGFGLLLCITIIGIPFGLQTMKLAAVSLWPFGTNVAAGGWPSGCLAGLMNLIWWFVGGIPIALTHLAWGIILCLTLIGIPFGLQHFKLMRLALFLFGKSVYN